MTANLPGAIAFWQNGSVILDSVRRHSEMPIAIQLAHAGRKASTEVPWKGSPNLTDCRCD